MARYATQNINLEPAWAQLGWSKEKHLQARAEGWSVQGFMRSVKPAICRAPVDNDWLFHTSKEALLYVQRRADEGSEFHAQALACVVALTLMGDDRLEWLEDK